MKNKCEHNNKKNLSSYHNTYDNSNFINVKCLDCGYERYETRYKNGRIDNSKWFKR